MLVIPFILAAGSLPTLISGLPVPSFPSSKVTTEVSTQTLQKRGYTVLGGTGEVADGWPSMSDWFSTFEEMFEANKGTMKSSCAQWNVENNSDEELANMSNSIKSVASSTGVDARFILAIVLQESNGCVRAPTTNYGVVNPGLMQSHDGSGSCNRGNPLTPCPASQITQMITDGTAGTASGDGLKQCLAQAGGTGDVASYYRAARIYNSGSIASSQNLGQGIATHCYASDIANRLTGWTTGPSGCDPNTIGELTSGAFSGGAGSPTTSTTSAPTTTSAPATTTIHPTTATFTTASTTSSSSSSTTSTTVSTAKPTVPATTIPVSVPSAASTPTVAPTASSSPSASAKTSSSDAPIYPYATPSCQEYYTIQTGDYCFKVETETGITAAQLLEWNAGLDEACTNLWLGYQYCVKA
ncbi:hypothetical protein Asppvi_001954 [Aspergillus pseudoviridinutans]|uniref:LysM domain-containing protein n=1 Tax=Aspergillus pseudoviridinutans TaxID=1517512 RepID=A0A9P3BS50_9EURO|nr:uncharacterized protein Asppvi_001954 [Aspergillus pseudoviridinutans]GIJ92676.1 hypothetical protein Asppvi_001954 [Aspergillus pseudoviridinutans]